MIFPGFLGLESGVQSWDEQEGMWGELGTGVQG